MGHPLNRDKNRKSDAQEVFGQAENAGRFAGNDSEANAAKQTVRQNISQDVNSNREERARQNTDAEARRDPEQTHDYKGESQNVNDDSGRPLKSEEELQHARNKANESKEDTEGIP